MAEFTHMADCGIIGEQELTVRYEFEGRRPIIKDVFLFGVPVEVPATYLVEELYAQLFEIERDRKDQAIEMRRAA